MNEQTRFDPHRSDAIRRTLVAEAASAGATPRSPRRRQRRIAIGIVAAAVLGGLGAGGAALALGGVTFFDSAPDDPVTEAPSASPSAPPSPTATPTPTPPPNPATAPVRVPLGCDALLPQVTAQALAGAELEAVTPVGFDPLSFADVRAGALVCDWMAPVVPDGLLYAPSARLTVVPSVSVEDYEALSKGIDMGGFPPVPGQPAETRENCSAGSSNAYCSLIGLYGEYGVQLSVVAGPDPMSDEQVESVRAVFASVAEAATGAGASAPLWQPTGADLAGVSSCDGLITEGQLGSIVGDPSMSNHRSAEGEYRIATFRSNAQVGGYACGWFGVDAGIWASVLPGGAAYFPGAPPLDGGEWIPAPDAGYPGEAFVSNAGNEASVLVDNAWFLVRVPEGQVAYLPDIVGAVVTNVVAAG